MLKKNDIEYASKLARIELTSNEKERLQKDLSNVLNYVEKLQKIDTSKVELMSRSTKLNNVSRKDVVKESSEKKEIKDLFPEEKNGFLKVKPIF